MIKQLLGVIFIGVLSLSALYFFFEVSPRSSVSSIAFRTQISNIAKEKVIIFAGSTYFGVDYTKGNHALANPCPMEEYCRITSNASELDLADAVVYHNRDFNGIMLNNASIQVMFTSESPVNERIRFEPGTINWTMTYRLDSEIYGPYGSIVKSATPNTVDFEALWALKEPQLTSTWMASNCRTGNKRMQLIKMAQRESLKIDIFGGCGKSMPRCGRYAKDQFDCAAKVLSKYKFYFAFENSNCPDYVTEKFWNALNLYKAVPIVIERKSVENLLVPGSAFIALDDFSTVKDMVVFINNLKDDKKQYLGYHKWRQEYSVKDDHRFGFCALCRRLREPFIKPHVYQNLAEWYSPTTCNNSYAFHYLPSIN